MKGASTIKCTNTSIIRSQNGNVDSLKALAHNTVCILVMTEKWQKCLDKGGISEAILTDLSKAFDCILRNLLIAKLAAYGFDYQSLRIMESFLSNKQQRTKIKNKIKIKINYIRSSTRISFAFLTCQYLYL